jgi:hypothetical protein
MIYNTYSITSETADLVIAPKPPALKVLTTHKSLGLLGADDHLQYYNEERLRQYLENYSIRTGLNNVYTKPETVELLSFKQDKLTSGTNIKTINNISMLGSGNIHIDSPITSVNGQTGAIVLTKNDIGLGFADDTSDMNKPVSTLQQSALNAIIATVNQKQDILTSGYNIKTVNNQSLLGSGNIDLTAGVSLVNHVNGLTGDVNIKTINGYNIMGVGNVELPLTAGVLSLNNQQGHLNIKTINGIPVLGSGDITIVTDAGVGVYMPVTQRLVVSGDVYSRDIKLTDGTLNIQLLNVTSAGWQSKVYVNSKGLVTSGGSLVADDIPGLDCSKLISGTIDSARLPSYVDDVLDYINRDAFPLVGEGGKIYIDTETDKQYRWGGSAYSVINSGAVSSVAGKTGVITLNKADVGLENIDNTSDADKPVSALQQLALNDKQDTLISGLNIKTINGVSLLGSGEIVITNEVDNIVLSVAGKVGVITLDNTDVGLDLVHNIRQLSYDQTLILTGDIISIITDLNTGTIETILSSTGILPGDYKSVTVDEKGRITAGTNPSTLEGYGITDAQSKILTGTNACFINGIDIFNTTDGVEKFITAAMLGLDRVENTNDSEKPVSLPQQLALDTKQDKLTSGSNIKTINGENILDAGDLILADGWWGPSKDPYVTTEQVTINGGWNNTIGVWNYPEWAATVVLGSNNNVDSSGIVIGDNNDGSGIIFGIDNQITTNSEGVSIIGVYNTVDVGFNNFLAGYRNFSTGGNQAVFGYGATALSDCKFIFGNSGENNNTRIVANQIGFIALKCVSSDITPVLLLPNQYYSHNGVPKNFILVDLGTTMAFEGTIVGNVGGGESVSFKVEGLVRCGATIDTCVLVGSTITPKFGDVSLDGCVVSISARSDINHLEILITGLVGKNISWNGYIDTNEVR